MTVQLLLVFYNTMEMVKKLSLSPPPQVTLTYCFAYLISTKVSSPYNQTDLLAIANVTDLSLGLYRDMHYFRLP